MNIIILIIVVSLACLPLMAETVFEPESLWLDGVAVQHTAKTPAMDASIVQAQIDGVWKDYPLVEFPRGFWEWNRQKRHEYLDIFREMLNPEIESPRSPQLSGPHNGIVATFGAARADSEFKLNNAIKGMGFLPKEEILTELIKELETRMEDSLPQKLDFLDSLYAHAEEVFAHDRLVSLELYAEPSYNTQTFINQMLRPEVVIVWMDIPTYKMKSIVRLLDPQDNTLTQYEKDTIRYINLIHSFFHGRFSKEFIAVVYYSVEIYDSSPGRPGARGTRIR